MALDISTIFLAVSVTLFEIYDVGQKENNLNQTFWLFSFFDGLLMFSIFFKFYTR